MPNQSTYPNLSNYKAKSGTFVPVYTLEIQTIAEDTDRILDAVMQVYPLRYGRYQRNASISAVGMETAQPEPGSTTTTHSQGFVAGQSETYPMVELKISIERDTAILERVMDAILAVHHYEEPVIFLREDWASRAAYNPHNNNPHRWWNRKGGLQNKLDG